VTGNYVSTKPAPRKPRGAKQPRVYLAFGPLPYYPGGPLILLTVTVNFSILLKDKVDNNYLFITFRVRSSIITIVFNYYILYYYLLYILIILTVYYPGNI